MKCNTRIWQFAAAVTIGSLLALVPSISSAQAGDNQPQRISVTTVQVKPDMVGTFEDLVKQTIGPLTDGRQRAVA